ncbi:MAG: endolytic transglycosylase MltG [Pseudomonadota bacterium]|nr:endolytic transglycosylase MltG [Pseudomonadota bacterium]
MTAERRFHLIAALLLLVVVAAARVYVFFDRIDAPLKLDEPKFIIVEPGTNLRRIVRSLQAERVLPKGFDLLVYARLDGSASRIKTGEYELTPDLTARTFLQKLVDGDVVYHQVRIVEGWTLKQALDVLHAHPALVAQLDANDPQAIQQAFDTDTYPEGQFFPDTYNFTRGTTDVQVLQRARALMQQVLDTAWAARDANLPYASPQEALVMASIVEKETAIGAERTQIAGVFVRRLQRNMRLQTDPTVIYGLGAEFDGNLTRAHLTSDTPWNTYTRDGLPPTPIALPGRASIEASMHPDDSDALYFVARGDGSHYFSATLEEHNRAVRQYQLNGGQN